VCSDVGWSLKTNELGAPPLDNISLYYQRLEVVRTQITCVETRSLPGPLPGVGGGIPLYFLRRRMTRGRHNYGTGKKDDLEPRQGEAMHEQKRMLRSTSKVGRSLLLSVCGEGRVSDGVAGWRPRF
jgi:hypothetical protein